MNEVEALQLLALVKLAYPTAYRYTDAETAKKEAIATANMWQMSFPDVPYPIMEQAFNHFRMVSKFPPTLAEMAEELRQIHFHATECALIHKTLGDEAEVRRYKAIMDCTLRYKNNEHMGLQLGNIPMLEIGGDSNVQKLAAPGD